MSMMTTTHSMRLLLLLFFLPVSVTAFGSMGPISAAYGGDSSGLFCAIDASGKQQVICWGKNSSSSLTYFTGIPPMAALSGGEGFLCGILANSSLPYCWSTEKISLGDDLVPPMYKNTAYKHIAAGSDHVCAIRGSYYSESDSGSVDCWDIDVSDNNSSKNKYFEASDETSSVSGLVLKNVVSGEGFSCGGVREGGVTCWGKNSWIVSGMISEKYDVLASGRSSVCGISESDGLVSCWGHNDYDDHALQGTRFVALTAGAMHFCGIREDNHGVECWGVYNSSLVPKGPGFMAVASSDFTTCGIREDDLVLDCWFANTNNNNVSSPRDRDYDPPLQLCSPGLCTPSLCGENKFSFNVSVLNEPDLTSLCVRKNLKVCSPCGFNCSEGTFLSSSCTQNADRVCTSCSLCQNSSCWDACGLKSSSSSPDIIRRTHDHELERLLIIAVSSVLGFLIILIGLCLLKRRVKLQWSKNQFGSCIGKSSLESKIDADTHHFPLPMSPAFGTAQVFRLTELKDATNGFKEFNEVGRGSYGFVYKAVLIDGTQVAVKRANAATIIHTNSREFEMELEILCNIRHTNIVNLLGYCSEMGERLLVYEFMPHGTLHDHLHGGLSPLNWSLRLKIAMQAAKGLEYLHREVVPPIVHGDVKTSNVLLDSEWGARIADFGILGANEKDINEDMSNDVYKFGIVLLEILSGRKAHDTDYTTPSIVEWAVPLIKLGKAAAIIDRYVALPRNVEPLLKLADIAELGVREDPLERPTMSDVSVWLEQIVKDGLIL